MPTRLPSFTNSSSAKSTQASRWRRTMVAFSAVVVLAACSSSHVVRYKISFTVEVDGEDRTGSSVIETTFYGGGQSATSPRRYSSQTKGVAPVIDLGQRGWLVATLSYQGDALDKSCKSKNIHPRPIDRLLDVFELGVADLANLSGGKRDLSKSMMPAFVWFPANQPYTSAQQTCADQLNRVVGTGVYLKSATIELVPKAQVKTVLDIRAPWLDEMHAQQVHGGVSTRHGIFKPSISNFERPGVEQKN